MAENEVAPPALGVSWDGTGYGLDGTIWGGEFFLVTDDMSNASRICVRSGCPAATRPSKNPAVPRSDCFMKFPAMLFSSRTNWRRSPPFPLRNLPSLKTMLVKKLNSPVTTSVGRLFDAVASLIDLRQQIRFEGQAAMELEFAAGRNRNWRSLFIDDCNRRLPIKRRQDRSNRSLDWSPMIEAMLADVKHGITVGIISAKFHNALVGRHRRRRQTCGPKPRGAFRRLFSEPLSDGTGGAAIAGEGFRPYWHQRVPPNDGGIALGQVVAALRR